MTILNWKWPFGLHGLYKLFQRCKGLNGFYTYRGTRTAGNVRGPFFVRLRHPLPAEAYQKKKKKRHVSNVNHTVNMCDISTNVYNTCEKHFLEKESLKFISFVLHRYNNEATLTSGLKWITLCVQSRVYLRNKSVFFVCLRTTYGQPFKSRGVFTFCRCVCFSFVCGWRLDLAIFRFAPRLRPGDEGKLVGGGSSERCRDYGRTWRAHRGTPLWCMGRRPAGVKRSHWPGRAVRARRPYFSSAIWHALRQPSASWKEVRRVSSRRPANPYPSPRGKNPRNRRFHWRPVDFTALYPVFLPRVDFSWYSEPMLVHCWSTVVDGYINQKTNPSKHDTLNQCWFNVGPASQTVGQR